MSDVCKHGSLRRQCEICALVAENAELKVHLKRYTSGVMCPGCDHLRLELWEARADNARLRAAIMEAPHGMGCASLQDDVPRAEYGSAKHCDCWKAKAGG